MSLVARLKARLAARPDSEHEQALLRIAIVGLVLAYMTTFHDGATRWTDADLHVAWVLASFLAIAVAIFVTICVDPAPNRPRRIVGMIADASGCIWYMSVAEAYGFFVIGIFLFITFGNGFRYGRRYLFLCQAMCVAGLAGILVLVPYWQERRVEGVGLLIALLVLPVYVSTLLKRIHEARARAEEANIAKSTFLANMSHEIRTPLNGIVGVVDLFEATDLTAQQEELTHLLRHSVTVLRSLVDDVLDISKIEAGRVTVEVTSFDLHGTIGGLVALLRPHAQEKGLMLHASVDPEIDYRLKGDPHHLRQVLLNLLTNAIKFTERGEVGIHITRKQETPEGVTVRFEVRDTGVGIAPEALPRIFDRFVQADQSTTRRFGGSGLGTTIAKQLVQLMGGSIGVTSTFGEGSTFWVELPFLRDVSSTTDGEPPAASRGRILVVAAEGRGQLVLPKLKPVGATVEIIAPSEPFGSKLDAMLRAGIEVRAIVVADSVDTACSCFAVAVQRLGNRTPALLHVVDHPLDVVDSARVKSIPQAHVLLFPLDPRVVANAIHAATASAASDEEQRADLTKAIRQARRRLHVLIADDNQTNRAILIRLLGAAGHTTVEATDGEQALDAYERDAPDMALIDFNMPLRSGLEVVSAIRMMEPVGRRIPLIVLSASVTLDARNRALSAGADDFFGKPLEAAALIRRMDALARSASMEAGPRANAGQPPSTLTHPPETNRAAGSARARNDETLDYDRLQELEEISGTPDFMAKLLRGFVGDFRGLQARLELAISENQDTDIPDILHAMKGAAVGVGATRLAGLCESTKSSAGDDPQATVQLANRLRTAMTDTFAHLDAYLHTHHRVSL